MEIIHFYKTKVEYGYFSNFAPYPIKIDGTIWPTTEHYFQAQKFAGTEHESRIRKTPSPMSAARMGRDRKRPLRSDWENVKNDVMYRAIQAKFTQHPSLLKKLLDTGDAILVEHTFKDSYWGDGGDGKGKNMLGKLLMKLREELKND